MPRRNSPPKRVVDPDPRYDNVHIEMFINRMMYGGKKSTARRIMYDALSIIEERTGRGGDEIFEQALANVTPKIEVRPRRVGGSTYQVPIEPDPHRATSLAMRWLLQAARNRGGRGMVSKLANEVMDASNKQGNAVKRREEVHKMAEANRTFAHFRW
ncbi:MAG: 30S ribosomal protein S7 [Chloroflexi bacterium]|nr:30S ribosomal protein S7 [Chloroflexota bacterium]